MKKLLSFTLSLVFVFTLFSTNYVEAADTKKTGTTITANYQKEKTVIDVFKQINPANYKNNQDLENGIRKTVHKNISTLKKEKAFDKLDEKEITDNIYNKILEFNKNNLTASEHNGNESTAFRTSNSTSTSYWWGVSHRFYTYAAADEYAHNIVTAANVNAGAAFIAGAVFGGIGAVPNGLTAVFGYQLAEDVRYNASKYGGRISVDISYVLVYSIYGI